MRTKHADRDTVTQFATKLTEKGATRSSVMMSKRIPSGFTELKEMPRAPAMQRAPKVMRSGARMSTQQLEVKKSAIYR